jgi:hypothetical protein
MDLGVHILTGVFLLLLDSKAENKGFISSR